MSLAIRTAPSADWNEFVAACADASLYHRAEFTQLISQVFRQSAWFLEKRGSDGRLCGVLPLVRQRGPVAGSFMTSLPYFNYGGVLAESENIALELMEAGKGLAQRAGCRYLEYRDVRPREGAWKSRTDKVSMVLDLPPNIEALGASLGAKLRSQARRPNRDGAQVHIGGVEQLEAFYEVFRRNMHALGTPVYPRRFFRALLEKFPQNAVIVVVSQAGLPQAAGFLLIDRASAEIPWAACREEAKPRGYNMKLYWECLSHAIERGCARFDFGRSTKDAGTYRFKSQWGAQPVQLHWHRWERRAASGHEVPGPSRLQEIVVRAWKALPLPVANLVGPLISPRLPW